MKPVPMPDELDRRILRCLAADARQSFRQIARALGTSTPTVSYRVRRMEEAGLIKGYTVRLRSGLMDEDPPEPWTCPHCKGPIRLPATVARFADRAYAFCCVGCRDAFGQRLVRLSRA